MKLMFINPNFAEKIILPDAFIQKLPQKTGLASTTQFANQLEDIKKQIKNAGKDAVFAKGNQPLPGQILGCDVSSAEKISNDVDAFLYIGDGLFHPIGLGIIGKKVYCYNPYTKQATVLDEKVVERYKKRRKGALLKYLSSGSVGILVSTKAGQNSLAQAVRFKKQIEQKGKNGFIFIFNTLDFNQLENFTFVDCWVNTACPRLLDDSEKFGKAVINLREAIENL